MRKRVAAEWGGANEGERPAKARRVIISGTPAHDRWFYNGAAERVLSLDQLYEVHPDAVSAVRRLCYSGVVRPSDLRGAPPAVQQRLARDVALITQAAGSSEWVLSNCHRLPGISG